MIIIVHFPRPHPFSQGENRDTRASCGAHGEQQFRGRMECELRQGQKDLRRRLSFFLVSRRHSFGRRLQNRY